MVEINPNDRTKLTFRKLNDPNDSLPISIYKRLFRYASPNLFIWGPLAPAHDALLPRTAMARVQIALGIILIGGTFRRYSSLVSAWRRRISRFTSFTAGISLVITGAREVSYFYDPHSNPLYVEIQLARELSLLDPANGGKTNRGGYWFGPKNFMPMDNEQYWKMVYAMEVNEIMAEKYLRCGHVGKYESLLLKNYGGETQSNKAQQLSQRIEDITKNLETNANDASKHHASLDKAVSMSATPAFPLFEKLTDGRTRDTTQTLLYWAEHNPFDALQMQEYREYYAYVFPRLQFQEDLENEKS
jgi:hypothetical protein